MPVLFLLSSSLEGERGEAEPPVCCEGELLSVLHCCAASCRFFSVRRVLLLLLCLLRMCAHVQLRQASRSHAAPPSPVTSQQSCRHAARAGHACAPSVMLPCRQPSPAFWEGRAHRRRGEDRRQRGDKRQRGEPDERRSKRTPFKRACKNMHALSDTTITHQRRELPFFCHPLPTTRPGRQAGNVCTNIRTGWVGVFSSSW